MAFSRTILFKNVVIGCLFLSTLARAQAPQFRGQSTIKGPAQASSTTATQNVHIYVVFPPASNPAGGKNNDNFRQYVMTQGAIDGVTVLVNWSDVETSHGSGSCGANSDTCQLDLAGQYHVYNWNTVDGSDCPNSTTPGSGLGQWFCTKMWGQKKVNPLIFGISGNPNTSTPAYVFTQGWANDVNGGVLQDVINKNKDNCGSYTGYVPFSMSMNAGVVHVTMSGSMPFQNNDTIWIAGAENALGINYNVITPAGTTVQNVNLATLTFDYTSGCVGCNDASAFQLGSIVSSASSWPIPTELPYQVAFRAFVAAAVYHFSHTNTGSGGVINAGQVAYMRVGYARGGEAIPECLATWPGGTGTKQNWLNFYADMSSYLMGLAASAPFQIQTSINEVGTDTDYGTQEAGISVEYYGGNLRPFGFGAQGLQSNDQSSYPNCASDWCTRFETFWRGGTVYKDSELELQQIDCSDPTHPASTTLQCAQNYNSITGSGTSKTGDLTSLLPFATQEHMTILELYSQDALLTYDPNFCAGASGGSCASGGGTCPGANTDVFTGKLTVAQQNQFYRCVGQGGTCSGNSGCYNTSVDSVHGLH